MLLEREAELGSLVALLDGAGRGRRAVVLLEGRAGTGNSAVLDRATELAGDLDVLRARGDQLERAYGWGVARSLFEPALAARSPAERDQLLSGPAAPARRLFDPGEQAADTPSAGVAFAILHALYWLAPRLAERAPVLLVVDDAQWADEPSLRFLVYLLGRIADQPIALLVAARTGEGGDAELLEQLASDPAAQVRVPAALGAGAVA